MQALFRQTNFMTAEQFEKQEDKMHALESKLSALLADAFVLSLRLQAIHWHATGSNAFSLHNLTDEAYKTITEKIDELAERMRMLDLIVPSALLELSNLTQVDVNIKFSDMTTSEMIKQILRDLETCSYHVKEVAIEADENKDHVTHDLLVEIEKFYQKQHWFFRAIIEN